MIAGTVALWPLCGVCLFIGVLGVLLVRERLDACLEVLSPYFWASMGIGSSFGLSIVGAAWYNPPDTRGIYLTGAPLLGAAVKEPRIRTKNLISILFCEAVAIYGLVFGIVLCARISLVQEITNLARASGYAAFWSGITVGLCNLICGIAVGSIGGMTAIADAANPKAFVSLLVAEILASSSGLFGLIVGFVMVSRVEPFMDKK